jgi:hypothetical protein
MTRTNGSRHGHERFEAIAALALLPARGLTAMAWLIALIALLLAGSGLGR